MFHLYILQRCLLLLCGLILPLLCVKNPANDSFSLVINTWAGNYEGATDKGSGNYSEFVPLVINTWAGNHEVATDKAWKVLEKGGLSLDAIEEGITACELNQCGTHRVTVGYGGSPNEVGETTLDALIIDGATHAAGAVGCLKRVKTAISVARAVMENTRATLLVGEDATQFALQMGFREQDLHTNESVKMWKEWKKNKCQPNFWNENVRPNPHSSCGPYKPTNGRRNVKKTTKQTMLDNVDANNHDTIGMIAIDQKGNMAAGTSTNGLNHKIAGRVGDSPIPGAGAYVDKDVGGAAGTGDGDVMLKFLPSFHAVELLRQGYSPTRAARMALKKIAEYYPAFRGGLITVTKDGRHGAACHGWSYFPYTVRNPKTGKNKIVYIKPCKLIN